MKRFTPDFMIDYLFTWMQTLRKMNVNFCMHFILELMPNTLQGHNKHINGVNQPKNP